MAKMSSEDYQESAIVRILDELEAIRDETEEVERDLEVLKGKQNKLLTTPVPDKSLRDEVGEVKAKIQKTAGKIRSQLLSIQQTVKAEEAKGRSSTSLRIQKSQHEILWKRYTELMGEFAEIEQKYNDKCKERLKRQLEITGVGLSDEELNEMIESDKHETGVFSSMIGNNIQAQQMLMDVQTRNEEIKHLESDITQLRDLFLDVQLLVAEQGETVGRVESHIAEASVSVEKANKDLKKAAKFQNKSRRKRLLLCVVLPSIVATVVILILVVIVFCIVLEKC